MLLAVLFIQLLLTYDWQVSDMANRINPPPQLQVPPALLKDKPTRDYLRQVETILFQLWQRTGGDTDIIDDGQNNITSTSSRVSRNAARINSLELKEFEILTTLIDLTTDRNQIILCKNVAPITIILDPQAVEEDEVHVKRRGEEVTVIGLIDGSNDQIINVLNWSAHYVFDGTDWSSI